MFQNQIFKKSHSLTFLLIVKNVSYASSASSISSSLFTCISCACNVWDQLASEIGWDSVVGSRRVVLCVPRLCMVVSVLLWSSSFVSSLMMIVSSSLYVVSLLSIFYASVFLFFFETLCAAEFLRVLKTHENIESHLLHLS